MSLAVTSSAETYTFVPASSDDAAGLAALHATCFDDPWNAELIGRVIGAPTGYGVIARQGGEIIGFVLCRMAIDEGEVLTLCVAASVRRRGIGRALLQAAVGDGTGRGLSSLYLEVAENNLAARALYSSFGFDQVGRRSAYYRDASGMAVDALTLRYCRGGAGHSI